MAVLLVTGASRGLGREIALAGARRGHEVVAGVRDPARCDLGGAAGLEGLAVGVSALDVRDDGSVRRWVAAALERHGRVDVVVNNAAVGLLGALEDLPDGALHRVLDTNVVGPLRVTRAVLPAMRGAGRGCIAMVSSVSGFAGTPADGAYAASKFALEGAAEALALEVAPFGVRVVVVQPGHVATGMTRDADPRTVCPDGSPYAELVGRVEADTLGSEAGGDPVHEVAGAILDAAFDPGAPVRVQVGELARTAWAARRSLDDAAWRALLVDTLDLRWWLEPGASGQA